MKDSVDVLKEIIEKYPTVLNDDKKLKSILKDFFPEDKRLQNHLYMVADEGIVDDMKEVSEVKKFKILGYIHALSNDYGISETMAKDVVFLWARALGIKTEDVQIEDPQRNIGPDKKGNIIDYSNIGLDDLKVAGETIVFSGVGEKIIPNVKFNGGAYVVKCSDESSLIMRFYDYNKNSEGILNGNKETIWKPRSTLKFDKPGIIQIFNTKKEWKIEMIPI